MRVSTLRTSKNRLRMTAALVVTAFAASGCAAGAGATSGSGGVTGSQLTMSVPAVPNTLYPLMEPVAAQFAHLPMLSSLLQYEPQERDETVLAGVDDVVPGLAESYELTPEGLLLELRPATSSAGNTLTAEDVAYTFERAVAVEDSIGKFLMTTGGIDPAEPVTVIDDDTVRLNGAFTPLVLFAITYYYPGILDSTVVKQHVTEEDPWAAEWLRTNSANFGPYTVESFEPGQRIVYTANENYWEGEPPYDRVVVLGAGAQSPVQLLKSGSADFAARVPGNVYAEMKDTEGFDSYVSPSLSQQVVVLNKKATPALENPDVRRALSMALDRQLLADTIYSGTARPAQSVLSASVPGIGEASGRYYSHDLDAAKSLLATTPYAEGFDLTLTISAGSAPGVDANSVAIALQSAWKELGVTVQIENIGSASRFSEVQTTSSFEALLTSEAPAAADIPYAMSLLHAKGGPFNYGFDDDAVVADLVTQAVAQPLGDERARLGIEAVKAWNETMGSIPLVDTGIAYVSAESTCGLATYPYLAALAYRLSPC